MAKSGTQTIVEAFALHRWRLRSGEEIERETAEATRLLAGDETERARGVARLTDALRYAPYHLAIHDALAAHAATVGDSDAGFRHLAARVEATGEVPGPRSPALAAWPAKRRASLVAPLAALRPDRGRDLHVEELAPVRASCGILRWTADRTDAVRLVYRRFLESGRPRDVEAYLDKLGEGPFVLGGRPRGPRVRVGRTGVQADDAERDASPRFAQERHGSGHHGRAEAGNPTARGSGECAGRCAARADLERGAPGN